MGRHYCCECNFSIRTGEPYRAQARTYDGADNLKHELQIGAGYVSLMAPFLDKARNIFPYGNMHWPPAYLILLEQH
jgi:hypothetical protein